MHIAYRKASSLNASIAVLMHQIQKKFLQLMSVSRWFQKCMNKTAGNVYHYW